MIPACPQLSFFLLGGKKLHLRALHSTDGGTTWANNGSDFASLNTGCATSSAGTTIASWKGFSLTASSVLLRIYPDNASASTGTMQIYGLNVVGNVNVVGAARKESNVDEGAIFTNYRKHSSLP